MQPSNKLKVKLRDSFFDNDVVKHGVVIDGLHLNFYIVGVIWGHCFELWLNQVRLGEDLTDDKVKQDLDKVFEEHKSHNNQPNLSRVVPTNWFQPTAKRPVHRHKGDGQRQDKDGNHQPHSRTRSSREKEKLATTNDKDGSLH